MRSPWAWFRDLFARNGEDPASQFRWVLPYPVAGLNLTADECLSLATTWACIRIIAEAVGKCPWYVYEPKGAGRRELLYDHPLAWLLNTRPNPDMTAIGFREAMMFVAIPFGNAYAEIVLDGAGRVAQLWPLPHDRVTPRRDPETWQLFYEYRQPDGTTVRLEQRQVFHLRGPGLHGLMGENIIARAAKSLAVAAAQERHSASYFGQGANPGGVLKYPGQLSPDRYQRLKDDWAEKKKGPENAHKPMILEQGMEWVANTQDPQKSQLVESRGFSVEEICRWFGVPPHKVQHLLHATFSNIEHQGIEFVGDAVEPWCKRLEQEADHKLLPSNRRPWRYTCIDTSRLKEGDAKSRAEGYSIMRQNGLMTANEIRAREGMNDAGADGDVLLVQSNLTTVQNILNPPKPPPAPGAPPAPGKKDDELDPATEPAEAVAREAVTAFVVLALERYSRRLANRRADLAKKVSGTELEERLGQVREAERPRLLDELAHAAPFAQRLLGRPLRLQDLGQAVDLVDAGQLPALVVRQLPAFCPRTE